MSAWTKEPWPEATSHPSYFPFAAQGDPIRMETADYERARACVNACAGHKSEELALVEMTYGMPALDALKAMLILVTEQRDTLKNALGQLIEVAQACDSWTRFPAAPLMRAITAFEQADAPALDRVAMPEGR